MAKRSKKKKESPAPVSRLKSSPAGLASPLFWQFTGWDFLRFALIAGAVFWIYAPTLHGDWLWDDDVYIFDDRRLRDLNGLVKLWYTPGNGYDFYPLEGTVLWVLWQLCGNDTMGYHLVTVCLHLGNSLLVWRLFSKLGLHLAWIGGLLFAIHPVQVESVAWASELKNTLSLAPFLLAMGFWIDYEKKKQRRDYGLALVFFLIAMLCKISMAPFPIIILVYAWWRKGRISWTDLKISTPFFAISFLLGMITALAPAWCRELQHLPTDTGTIGGFFPRLALIGLSLMFYFFKFFLPIELMPIYPQWRINPPEFWQFWPWPLMAAIIAWSWINRARWGKHVLLGLGFFTLNLLPLVGLVSATYMNFTWVMDHFLYLPSIGLLGLVVAGLGVIEKQSAKASLLYITVFGGTILSLLAWKSRSYAANFISQKTLWTYTLRHNSEAWPAYNNLGLVLMKEGQPAEAAEKFKVAIRISPTNVDNYMGLGKALVQLGREDEAIEQFQLALQINPNQSTAQNNLGLALFHQGKISEAIGLYQQAINLDPDGGAEAHYNLGIALAGIGRFSEAIEQYQAYLRFKSDNAEAFYNLGLALNQTGQVKDAISPYEQALRLKPDYIEAHNNLGFVFQQLGRLEEARAQYEQALQINPDYAVARSNLLKLQSLQNQRAPNR